MAGRTDNNIELLIGIAADTQGSKESIQTSLDTLSKQLAPIEIELKIDAKSQKVLDDLSKIDLSKLKAQIEGLNDSVGKLGQGLGDGIGDGFDNARGKVKRGSEELAKITSEQYEKAMNEASEAMGKAFGRMTRQGFTTVEEIERAFSKIDTNVKIDFDLSDGYKEIERFQAQIKRDGKNQTIEFNPAIIADGSEEGMRVWMPERIKETNTAIQQSTKSLETFYGSLERARNSGKLTEEQFEEFNRELSKLGTNVETLGFHEINNELDSMNRRMDKAIAQTREQREEEQRLTKETEEQAKLQRQIYDLETKLIALQKTRPKITGRDDYQEINRSINEMTRSTKLHQDEVTGLIDRYRRLSAETKEVGRDQMGILDSFKVAMERFPVWMAASTIFYGTVRTAREFATIIVDIDTKMTDLKKVMDSGTDFEEVFDRATQSAERFGQSISQTMDAYIEFARQGYGGAELGQLSDAAIVAGNVGDIETGQAAELMTASLIQWKMEAKDAMGVIDSWNQLSNDYATTVEKLAIGQTRAGATARAMGLDFDQLNAIIGTVTAATKQSGQEVGNFVKAVLPRLTAKPAQDALASLGVAFTDDEGNLRDIVQIYTEVAQRVQNISDAERIAVVEGLAGKYHISRMQALLDDLASADSMYRQMYETSTNSAGSAIQENEQYMESLEARMALARVEVEKLALALGDAFLTEGMIQAIQAFGDFLAIVTRVVDAVGALPVALGTVGVALYGLSGRFRGIVESLGGLVTGLTKSKENFSQVATSAATSTTALNTNNTALRGIAAATAGTTASTTAATAATTAFSGALRGLLASTGVGIALVGIGVAIEALLGKMAKQRQLQEEVESQMKLATETYNQSSERIQELSTRFGELEATINDGDYSPEEFKEYRDVGNELAALLPTLSIGEDAHGNAIMKSANAVAAKVAQLEREAAIQERMAAFESRQENLDLLEVSEKDLKSAQTLLEIFDVNKLPAAIKNIKTLTATGLFDKGAIQDIDDVREAVVRLEEERDRLLKGGAVRGESAQLFNVENSIRELTEFQRSYEEVEIQVQYAANGMINANGRLIDSALATSSQVNQLTRGLVNEISVYASGVGASQETMSKFYENLRKQAEGNGAVIQSIDNYADALDVLRTKQSEGASTEELTRYRDTTLEAYREMRTAVMDFAKDAGFNESELSGLTTYMESMQDSAVGFGISLEDLAASSGRTEEEMRMMLATMEGGDEVLAFLEEGAANAGMKIEDLADSLTYLTGVTQEQIETADSLVFNYDNLYAQLQTLDEGTEEYAATQEMLNQTKGALLEMYPHLFPLYQTAENLTYDQIRAIEQEILAEDTLRAAIKASRDGKLTAEENQTLASWQGTRARINNVNEEIRALSILARHYNAIQTGLAAARAATKLIPGWTGNMMSAAFGAQAARISQLNERYETATANLQKDLKLEKSYIDTLRTSQAVLDNGTSRANKNAAAQKKAADAKKKNSKASKDQSKAQKETNETIREAIYLADTYTEALERLALAIKKEQDFRSRYSDYSRQYRESIAREIELQKQQINLMEGQAKALQNQINKGVVVKRGEVLTTEYEVAKGATRNVKPQGYSGRITSQYGNRFHPIEKRWKMHQGVDVAGPLGSRLDSPVDGKVTKRAYHRGWGNYIEIQDNQGMKHLLAHMNSIGVKIGQSVVAGMQVGTIGKSGSATGPHLHYEVRNASGKLMNPNPYLQAARKGVTSTGTGKLIPVQKKTTTEEIAQSQADVDNLKGELLGLQGEILDANGLIRELQIESVNSQLAEFDRKRQNYQETIDYEREKIKGLDITNERYLKTLDIIIREMNRKQHVNNIEADYLDRMIKSGHLTAAATDNLKVRTKELATEMMALNAQIQELNLEKINVQMQVFERRRAEYQRTIDYEEAKIKSLDVTSERYVKTLGNYIREMNFKQRVNEQEIRFLNDMIKNANLSESATYDLRVRVQELTTEMMSLNNEIQQVSFDRITASMRKFEEALAELDYQLSNSDALMNLFEEGTGDYNAELERQLSLMKQRSEELLRQRYALERLILSENINVEQIKELKTQLQALNNEYRGLEATIKDTEEALAESRKQLAEEVADKVLDAYKEGLQQRQEAHMRALDKEMEAEDKRHNQIMENYREELDEYNKIIQAKIDAIDKEEDERSYNQEIDELEEERRKLTDRLNLLRLDDSFEAKAERKQLQEDISDIDEDIAERRHSREVQLRKDALSEMMDDKQEEVSEREELENERHEAERERIDKEREYWNQYYQDRLNDERRFAEIREAIVSGNMDAIQGEVEEMIGELINSMPELENTLDGTMAAVGTSIRQNVIDNLREALELMRELPGRLEQGTHPQTQLLSEADMKVLTGKFITENLAEQFDDDLARQANVRKKGYALAAEGRQQGSTIPTNIGYDAYLSRLTPAQQEQLRAFIGQQSGMYLTPKYNEALEDYGRGERYSAADFRVLAGKFMVDKVAPTAAKNARERDVILGRGRTWGQQGRAQGSKLDQYAGFDQLVKSMDNNELTEFANYLLKSNMFSEYYLNSFVEDYVKRMLATATTFSSGGYTGSWSTSKGKIGILHEKELVLNQDQTSGFLNFVDILDRLRPYLPSAPTVPNRMSDSGGGTIGDINFFIDKMNGDENDVRRFSKMFSDEMKRTRGWK